MIIDGIKITAKGFDFNNPPPSHDELKNYVDYVKEREPDVTKITVRLCSDGCVDLDYTAPKVSFERIRRITGKQIAARRQAV